MPFVSWIFAISSVVLVPLVRGGMVVLVPFRRWVHVKHQNPQTPHGGFLLSSTIRGQRVIAAVARYRHGGLLEYKAYSVPDTDGGCSAGQSLNPAFVHALAVPEVDMVDKVGKVCVVARGDGVVEVIDIESELASSNSKNSLKPHKGAQLKAKGNASSVQTETQGQN